MLCPVASSPQRIFLSGFVHTHNLLQLTIPSTWISASMSQPILQSPSPSMSFNYCKLFDSQLTRFLNSIRHFWLLLSSYCLHVGKEARSAMDHKPRVILPVMVTELLWFNPTLLPSSGACIQRNIHEYSTISNQYGCYTALCWAKLCSHET